MTNNEAIIRNACRDDSKSAFRNLPEITYVLCRIVLVHEHGRRSTINSNIERNVILTSLLLFSSSTPIHVAAVMMMMMMYGDMMATNVRRLVHIFQFARPEGFVAEKLAEKDKDKDAAGKPRKYDNRQNSYWYRQKKEREEAEKKLRLEKDVESADLDEMAAAAGSAVVLPVSSTCITASSGVTAGANSSGLAADASALASSNRSKGSRASGRKRSGEQISYNENAGDKEFEKQLRAFEKQTPAPVLKGFASVEGVVAGKKTTGDYDSDDDDDDEEKELRPIDELIDSLYEPGHQLTFSFLAPDTHLTGPCYRDFNRYVKTFPGWTGELNLMPVVRCGFHSAFNLIHVYDLTNNLSFHSFHTLFNSQAYQGH